MNSNRPNPKDLWCACVATAAILAVFSIVNAQPLPLASLQVRQKTFDAVWKTVNERYFDPTFGGVDWVAVRKRYEPQIASVASDREFQELLDRMLDEIKISHLNILDLNRLDKLLGRSVVNRGVALRDIDSQVVVTRVVEGSPAAAAGLRTGFIVKAIDGKAVASAKTAEVLLTTNHEKHRLVVVDEMDVTREVEIDYALPPSNRLESVPLLTGARHVYVETRILDGGIGYIHFTNFIAPMKARLLAAFDSMRDTKSLILDLRGNSGGETEVGLALAGMLLDKETQLAITQTRKGDDYNYKAKPHKNPYRGSVIVLLDQESASESEQVTAGLQSIGRVVVIGKKSRGEDMDATFQQLPMDSIALLYPIGMPRTPKGVAIEGRGVLPDIEVNLSRAELLKGTDSQLEAALRHLTKN